MNCHADQAAEITSAADISARAVRPARQLGIPSGWRIGDGRAGNDQSALNERIRIVNRRPHPTTADPQG